MIETSGSYCVKAAVVLENMQSDLFAQQIVDLVPELFQAEGLTQNRSLRRFACIRRTRPAGIAGHE